MSGVWGEGAGRQIGGGVATWTGQGNGGNGGGAGRREGLRCGVWEKQRRCCMGPEQGFFGAHFSPLATAHHVCVG